MACIVELPALEGMAIGTHEPPDPEAGADSSVFARWAETGWTKTDARFPPDMSSKEKTGIWEELIDCTHFIAWQLPIMNATLHTRVQNHKYK